MDPLSVAAAVVGIASAAGKLIPVFATISSTVKNSPKLAAEAKSEMEAILVILGQLQSYVFGTQIPSPSSASLILVEHVVVTLTDCVTVLSDLEEAMKSFKGPMSTFDRLKWLYKEPYIQERVNSLQRQKSSLGLMLTILVCTSMREAESASDSLADKVAEMLQLNQEIAYRIRGIDLHLSTEDTTAGASQANEPLDEDSVKARPSHVLTHADRESQSSQSVDQPVVEAHSLSIPQLPEEVTPTQLPGHNVSAFEEELSRSRVYMHPHRHSARDSLIDGGRRSTMLSINSAFSLADISNISVLALPIYSADLTNSSCYNFGVPATAAASSSSQELPYSAASQNLTKSGPKLHSRLLWWKSLKPRIVRSEVNMDDGLLPEIFGIALAISVEQANVPISLLDSTGKSFIAGHIPIILAKIGVFVKEHTRKEREGNICQESGNPKRIQELQMAFNSPPGYGRNIDLGPYTRYDAFSVLTRYISKLPEPVIPLDFYERFIDQDPDLLSHAFQEDTIAHVPTYENGVQYNLSLIKELPSVNRQLLLYILDLMGVLSLALLQTSPDDAIQTQAKPIISVFQPGVLSHPAWQSADDITHCCKVLMILFRQNNCGSILDELY